MADRYIGPAAAGLADGSSFANCMALSSLNTAITQAGPGGKVYIANHLGTYSYTGTLSLSAAGTVGSHVEIIGVNAALATGTPVNGRIIGNRTDWTLPVSKPAIGAFLNTSAYNGNTLLSFSATANFLTFRNIYFRNLGAVFSFGGVACHDITIEDCFSYNARRFIYTDATSAAYNIRVIRPDAVGFSKEWARMFGNCHTWYIEDSRLDAGWQDADNFCVGMRRSTEGAAAGARVGACHWKWGVTRTGYVRNIISTLGGYKNGDGLSEEHECYDLTMEAVDFGDVLFSDISDAALDSKGHHAHYINIDADGCGQTYKVFYSTVAPFTRIENCRSQNPTAFQSDKTNHHIWTHGLLSEGRGASTLELINFEGTGGPNGLQAIRMNTDGMTIRANDDLSGIVLPTGGVLETHATGSQLLINQTDLNPAASDAFRFAAAPETLVGNPGAVDLGALGLQISDFTVIFTGFNSAGDVVDNAAPAGWSHALASGSISTNIRRWWRELLSSADLNTPVAFGSGANSNPAPMIVQGFPRIDPVNPFDVVAATQNVASGGATADPNSITTVTPGAIVVVLGAMYGVDTTVTAPVNMADHFAYEGNNGTGADATIFMACVVVDTPGAFNPGTFTFGAGTNSIRLVSFALKPEIVFDRASGTMETTSQWTGIADVTTITDGNPIEGVNVRNIKDAPIRTLTYVVGVDADGKGGKELASHFRNP